MKRVIRNGVLCVALLTCLQSSAVSTVTEPTKTVFKLKHLKKGQRLYIKNANGKILFKGMIKDDITLSKVYDINALPDGYYTAEIEKDTEIKIIPFSVMSHSVEYSKASETVVFKPVVRQKDNLVFISKNSFVNSDLSFKVYFENQNDAIIKEKVENQNSFNRIYDFSITEKGTYTFVFKTEGRTFKERININ